MPNDFDPDSGVAIVDGQPSLLGFAPKNFVAQDTNGKQNYSKAKRADGHTYVSAAYIAYCVVAAGFPDGVKHVYDSTTAFEDLVGIGKKWEPGVSAAIKPARSFLTPAAVMTAIALAEAGGAIDKVSPTGDYGPFQINKKAWGNDPLWPLVEKGDCLAGAQLAKKIYEAGNPHTGKKPSFQPWVTFQTGAFLLYLPTGMTAVWNLPLTVSTGGVDTNVGNEDDAAVKWWEDDLNQLVRKGIWIGGGAILVLLAVIMLMKAQNK